MSDERQMGRLEQGLETLASGQATIISDLKEHRKEMFDLHASTAKRVSEAEGDIERVEAKIDGHAGEDDKRFASMRWTVGVGISLLVAVTAVMTAMADS